MNWMAWTPVTIGFFSTIGVMLACMTFFEIKFPTVERKGFLPIATTRGDRLFIGLLSSGFIHLFYVALSEGTLIIPLVFCIGWIASLLRWG